MRGAARPAWRRRSCFPAHRRWIFLLLLLIGLVAAAGYATAISLRLNLTVSQGDLSVAGAYGELLPSIISHGDWNGDGDADLMACSYNNNTCSIYLGGASVSGGGPLGAPQARILGTGLGASRQGAAFVGDVNGDGRDDVAFGYPGDFGVNTTGNGGSVILFYGRDDSWTGDLGIAQRDGRVRGLAANDRFGAVIAPAGDFDGDGHADFWVCAGSHLEGAAYVGEVFLIRGQATWNASANASEAAFRIVGVSNLSIFGAVLFGGRDINGDGVSDLLVGAPQEPTAAGDEDGAVFGFLGPFPSDGTRIRSTDANFTIRGNTVGAGFGSAIAVAQGFSFDGGATLFVGAPGDPYALGGSVFAFAPAGFACCTNHSVSSAAGRFYGTGNEALGTDLASGDVDGDGADDILIGAPNAAFGAYSGAGKTYFVYGGWFAGGSLPVDSANASFGGEGNGEGAGTTVSMFDFTNDTKQDLLMGAPRNAGAADQAGALYIFFGREKNRAPLGALIAQGNFSEGTSVQITMEASDPDGDAVAWSWDLDGDGAFGDEDNASVVTRFFPNNGTFSVQALVSDGLLSMSFSIQIVIANSAPVCALWQAEGFEEGRVTRLGANVSDPGIDDALTVIWSPLAGLTGSGANATFRPLRGGSVVITATVADADGASTNCTLSASVTNVAPSITVRGPGELAEAERGVFSVEITDPGAGDSFAIEWSVDGAQAGGLDASLAWSSSVPGTFQISVRVADLDGAESTQAMAVRVVNIPPNASLVIEGNAMEGAPAWMEVRQLSGVAFDPLTVAWAICGYGNFTGVRVDIVLAWPGRFCVEAVVTDDEGTKQTLTGILVVSNRAPLLSIEVTPPEGIMEGAAINVSATLGPWETSSNLTFAWRANGATFSQSRSATFVPRAGQLMLEVSALDGQGGRSVLNITVTVANRAPSVEVLGPAHVRLDEENEWTAERSDPSGETPTLIWKVDGREVLRNATLLWSFDRPGPHEIQAIVIDADGAISEQLVNVVVEAAPVTSVASLDWLPLAALAAAAGAAGFLVARRRRKGLGPDTYGTS